MEETYGRPADQGDRAFRAGKQFLSSNSKVFEALVWRKSAQLTKPFIESDDLLVKFDN